MPDPSETPVTPGWPSWLEGLPPSIQVREIVCALAAQYRDDPNEEHRLLATQAEPLLLGLLEDARLPYADGGWEALRADLALFLRTVSGHGHAAKGSPERAAGDRLRQFANGGELVPPAAEPGDEWPATKRAMLARLLETRTFVTVTNPANGSAWTGRIAAIADDPSIVLDCADGRRVNLPQLFEVSEVAVPPGETVLKAGAAAADLRREIDAALSESVDGCARCKVCDAQLDAVMTVAGPVAARLAELENALTWGTSCTSCATVLDSSVRETNRRELAEAQNAVMKAALHRLSLTDILIEPGDGFRAEFRARREYAAGTLETIARLADEPGSVRDSHNANSVTPEPEPPARLANVEIKGFRDLGVVAVSEVTLAGVPFLHAESRDGSAADFPASSVHFIAWLPPSSPWPEKPKAIAASPWAGDDEPDDPDDEYHGPDCADPESCDCAERFPF